MGKMRVMFYFEHGIHSSLLLDEKDIPDLLNTLSARADDWITLEYDDDRGRPQKQLIYLNRIVTVVIGSSDKSSIQAVRINPRFGKQQSN